MAVFSLISCGCIVLPFPSATRLAPAIEGRVYDATQRVAVSDAKVELRFDRFAGHAATTDDEGQFRLEPSQQRHWALACGIPVGAPCAYKIPNPNAIYQAGHATLVVEHPHYKTWTKNLNFGNSGDSEKWFHELRTIEIALSPLNSPTTASASTADTQIPTPHLQLSTLDP